MITMNKEMAHTFYLPPRCFWMRIAEFLSKHISCFTYNHYVIHNSMITHTIMNKIIIADAVRIFKDSIYSHKYMAQTGRILNLLSHK